MIVAVEHSSAEPEERKGEYGESETKSSTKGVARESVEQCPIGVKINYSTGPHQ